MRRFLQLSWDYIKIAWNYAFIFVGILGFVYVGFLLYRIYSEEQVVVLSPNDIFLVCGLGIFSVVAIIAITCALVQTLKERCRNINIANHNIDNPVKILENRVRDLEYHSQIDKLENRVKTLEDERIQKS